MSSEPWLYPWDKLEVGEHHEVDIADAPLVKSLRLQAIKRGRFHKRKFSVRQVPRFEPTAVRIVRVE